MKPGANETDFIILYVHQVIWSSKLEKKKCEPLSEFLADYSKDWGAAYWRMLNLMGNFVEKTL